MPVRTSGSRPSRAGAWPGSGAGRRTTTLNITRQVGASLGTAALTVILVNALTARLGAGGGLGAVAQLPPDQLVRVRPLLASSFGVAFWWAFGFVVVACLVALVLLPEHKPAPVDDDAPAPAAPTMLH